MVTLQILYDINDYPTHRIHIMLMGKTRNLTQNQILGSRNMDPQPDELASHTEFIP